MCYDIGGHHMPSEEVWLIGGHRSNGEHKYYLSNPPPGILIKTLACSVKACWICEQTHQKLTTLIMWFVVDLIDPESPACHNKSCSISFGEAIAHKGRRLVGHNEVKERNLFSMRRHQLRRHTD